MVTEVVTFVVIVVVVVGAVLLCGCGKAKKSSPNRPSALDENGDEESGGQKAAARATVEATSPKVRQQPMVKTTSPEVRQQPVVDRENPAVLGESLALQSASCPISFNSPLRDGQPIDPRDATSLKMQSVQDQAPPQVIDTPNRCNDMPARSGVYHVGDASMSSDPCATFALSNCSDPFLDESMPWKCNKDGTEGKASPRSMSVVVDEEGEGTGLVMQSRTYVITFG